MVLPDTVRSTLGRAGIVAGLPSDVAEALIRRLRLRDLAHGHTVYHEGEPGDGLYIVVTGKVKVGRRSADGREQLSAVMGPSDMFGVLSTFDPGPRTATATALTDVCVATTDRDVVRDWMRTSPDISERMLQVLAADCAAPTITWPT